MTKRRLRVCAVKHSVCRSQKTREKGDFVISQFPLVSDAVFNRNVLFEKSQIGRRVDSQHVFRQTRATDPVDNFPAPVMRMVSKAEYEKLDGVDRVIVGVDAIMEGVDLMEKNLNYAVNVDRANNSLIERLEAVVGETGSLRAEITRLNLELRKKEEGDRVQIMDRYKIETTSTVTIKTMATTIDTLTNDVKHKDEIIKSFEGRCAIYDKTRKDVISDARVKELGEDVLAEMENMRSENLQLSDDIKNSRVVK